jgi:hypothetical protein
MALEAQPHRELSQISALGKNFPASLADSGNQLHRHPGLSLGELRAPTWAEAPEARGSVKPTRELPAKNGQTWKSHLKKTPQTGQRGYLASPAAESLTRENLISENWLWAPESPRCFA